jgi:hypothetical protein
VCPAGLWWFLAIVLLLACVPAIWLYALRGTGIHTIASSDPFGFLSTFGGLMGAIFAAGGLVVALAAVLTVLTVEDRVQRAFDAEMPRVEQRAEQQIEGYLTFLEARWAADWRDQVRLANNAIQQHPGLRHKVRAATARRLAQQIIADFARRHTRVALEYHPPFDNFPSPNDALYQIWEAQASGGDPDAELAALEALMYGATGPKDYEAMMSAIRKGKATNPEVLAQLTPAPRLAMLVYACVFDEERLVALGEVLSQRLPATRQSVVEAIANMDAGAQAGQGPRVDWIVVGKLGASWAQTMDQYPATLRIFKVSDADGNPAYTAHFVPTYANDPRHVELEKVVKSTPGALFDKLNEWLLFVCRDTTRWSYPGPGEQQTVVG